MVITISDANKHRRVLFMRFTLLFSPTKGLRNVDTVYLVPQRKLGFFVQIKEGENFNRRNTLSISRIKI